MAEESAQPSLLRNASQTFANRLLDQVDQTSQQGPGQGYAPPESQQPGIARNTTQTERQRFELEQRRIAFEAFVQCIPILCCIWWLTVSFFGVTFYVYITGASIYFQYGDKPCDEPLATWLGGMLLILPIRMLVYCCRCCLSEGSAQVVGMLMSAFSVCGYPILLGLGVSWLLSSKTCEKTNPDLFIFIKIFLFYHVFQWAVVLLSICGFARIIFLMHSSGLMDGAQRPARQGLVNELEHVTFDPSLFSSNADEDKPSPECCICQEKYDDSSPIVKTQCSHYFHKKCLGEWLTRARTCPICREDLEGGGEAQGTQERATEMTEP